MGKEAIYISNIGKLSILLKNFICPELRTVTLLLLTNDIMLDAHFWACTLIKVLFVPYKDSHGFVLLSFLILMKQNKRANGVKARDGKTICGINMLMTSD